jgi:hypothetical protein
MNKKVAVVTDAISDQFFFPLWYCYYSNIFGSENLFLVTYQGDSNNFLAYVLGGIVKLPVLYSDPVRRGVITGLVTTLLETYDAVVRVDTDEILVVDPLSAPSLGEFVQSLDGPYITARGFDVVQLPDEAPLGEDRASILLRRTVAYPNSALNKTCIVQTPVNWTSGFHWCSTFPYFGHLFMLHLKRVDINWQLEWYTRISESTADADLAEYYRPDRDKILNYHMGLCHRPRVVGIENWYRRDHISRFLEAILYHPGAGIYMGSYGHESVLCEVPAVWKHLF